MHRDNYRARLKQMYRGVGFFPALYFRMKWRRGNVFEMSERFLPKRGLIVELGCGTGIFSNLLALASVERRILGLDIDRKRIAVARDSSTVLKNAVYRLADVFHEEIPPCEGIVMYDLIHHVSLEMQQRLFSLAFRLLKPGGVLLIKDVSRKPLLKFIRTKYLDIFNRLRRFTRGSALTYRRKEEVIGDLSRIGFHVETPKVPNVGSCPHSLYICTKIVS